MKNLKFNGRYKELILNGKKRATIRVRKVNLTPGDEILLHSGGYVLGRALIKKVEEKSLSELTDEDAQKDGFKTRNELINALKKHYKNINPDTKVTVVEFELKERFDRQILSADFPYEGNSPIEIAEMAMKHLDLSERDKKLIELFLKAGSLRKASYKLGGLNKRYMIREALRRAYEELKARGFMKPRL
ncbi:ASCH domain-containing protein [Thermococcus sp.]